MLLELIRKACGFEELCLCPGAIHLLRVLSSIVLVGTCGASG